MITATGLTRYFGRVLAVDAIDFEIPRGMVVGFLGPNGAGKTTTIRMISSYLPPDAGSITVDGLDVQTNSREVRLRIGYLPESAPLYTEMRVQEYLDFRGKLFGLSRPERRSAIARVVERCWLGDVERRPINQLSKGFRQRVGLAAAMLHDPPVLILDEPTVGLDPTQIREMRRLIRELAGPHTVLLSSHILPEIEVTCDRVLMIARGRIRYQGTLEELRVQAARSGQYVAETNIDHAAGALKRIKGVRDVEEQLLDNRWRRLRINGRDDAGDLREALAAALASRGGTTRELRREALSLEELFVNMAAEAEAEYGARQDRLAARGVDAEGAAA